MKKLLFVIVLSMTAVCFARQITADELAIVYRIADYHGVPRAVVNQQIKEESGGDTNAVSHMTAEGYTSQGLFQLYTRPDNLEYLLFLFWKQPRDEFDIFDPVDNAMVAIAYMEWLHSRFGNWFQACLYYNAGTVKNVPQHTRDYARRIVNAK